MRRLIDNGTTLPARPPYIGHYGHLRKAYLEGYRPDLYTALVASEKLYEHCAEIDAAARSLIDLIMPELALRLTRSRPSRPCRRISPSCIRPTPS